MIPQRRLTKRLRNASAAVFTLAYLGWALPALGLPRPVGDAALIAVLAGAGFAYLYEKGRTAVGFVRGLVAAALLETGALVLAATPLGPHLALPLYAAAFAWEERTVFWRYASPVLAAYALLVPLWLGGRAELVPHAIAGLAAWMAVRFLSRGARAEARRGRDRRGHELAGPARLRPGGPVRTPARRRRDRSGAWPRRRSRRRGSPWPASRPRPLA